LLALLGIGALGLEEDGQGGGEAVQEGLAADRPELAAAEEAGQGLRPERFADDQRVVVRRRKHVRAAAVAGEEQRSGWARARERAAQCPPEICVRRGGVADEEAQGLPDPRAVPERERACRLVGAEQAAHEEVADLVLGPVLVDHEPGQQPVRGERLFLEAEGADFAAQTLERRLSGQLVDEVALAARDHRLAPDRPAALRDEREDGEAADDDADRALGMDGLVQDQCLRAGTPPADGDPADERDPLVLRVQAGQERPGREAEGIDEQRDERRVVELGEARDRDPLVALHGYKVEALELRARQGGRPDGHSRTLLELAGAPDDSLGDAAEQVPGCELCADGVGGCLGLAQVRRGEEEEGEVDLVDPRIAMRLPRRLPRGHRGRRGGRETSADLAGECLLPHRATESTSALAGVDDATCEPGESERDGYRWLGVEQTGKRAAGASGRCRVLVVEDDDHFVQALTELLEADGRIEVAGRALDGREGLALAEALRPDVVLMDIQLPLLDGIEATRQLRSRQPSLPVIAITGSEYEERALEVRQAGAVDYVRKGRLDPDLAEVILAAARRATQKS
jgi:CheY-like chemotaxis protein